MRFHIGNTKLHADIPHETLTFLEDSKNALSPRMFNIFLCFFVVCIHAELISSQYMPESRLIQPREKGLNLRQKVHVHQLFPFLSPSLPMKARPQEHRIKTLSGSILLMPDVPRKSLFPLLVYHAVPVMYDSFPGKDLDLMEGRKTRLSPSTGTPPVLQIPCFCQTLN